MGFKYPTSGFALVVSSVTEVLSDVKSKTASFGFNISLNYLAFSLLGVSNEFPALRIRRTWLVPEFKLPVLAETFNWSAATSSAAVILGSSPFFAT